MPCHTFSGYRNNNHSCVIVAFLCTALSAKRSSTDAGVHLYVNPRFTVHMRYITHKSSIEHMAYSNCVVVANFDLLINITMVIYT